MSTATDMRDLYLQAEQDILSHGVTSRIGDRQLTTADLPEIREGRLEWERRVSREARIASGRSGTGFSVARMDE